MLCTPFYNFERALISRSEKIECGGNYSPDVKQKEVLPQYLRSLEYYFYGTLELLHDVSTS